MDQTQNRGRPTFSGNNTHRSPTPSPHHYHDAVSGLGLDPSVGPQTFTSGKFTNASINQFTTPYLESTHPQVTQPTTVDTNFYPNHQFNQTAYQENQWPGQTLDPSYPNNEYLYQNNNMQEPMHAAYNNNYQLNNAFASSQQSNVNPADLSSPHGPSPTSPDLLSPETNTSPQQPPSPASTQGHYYTPQHSRHQSLDPASAAYAPGEWQGMQFQSHRRAPSDQSDISSNSASPYLPQQEIFDTIETGHSPLVNAQQDGSSTFGIDQFSLADQSHVSPGHSPYISPRLLPQQTQGTIVGPEAMMAQHNLGQTSLGGPGPEIYATQPEEPYREVTQLHGRNDSAMSDMGQADQYVTPSINIEPAPVSRQASFEVDASPYQDALSPPGRHRGRSKSDPFSRPSSRGSSPGVQSPPTDDRHSVRSLSPGVVTSRDSSPAPGSGRIEKNRRSSTSSIPTRDYILDLADPSRPTAATSTTSNRVQKHPATFQCGLCPKRFTRAYNLRSHLRTHTDERPFVCTVCGKAFARQHDRKRHEGLHSGEKKFVCRGDLGSGLQWGCGRRFARADALGRHFRSEAGRVCIKPLLDEEAAERQRQHMMDQQQPQYSVGSLQPVQQQMTFGTDAAGMGFALPAALLVQYPALNNIDWSTIPQGEDPGEMSDVGMGGRSSFDASSGGEYYAEEEIDNGYVSGNGMTFNNSGQGAW